MSDKLLPEREIVEICPADMVEQATEITAAEIYELLKVLTLQETIPEDMREDTRMRMIDLIRRFPQAFPDPE
jgi:hypothetical protein